MTSRRLRTVTALLMTPEDFPGEPGQTFQQVCAALHVAPTADRYGLVLAQDQESARWTQVTTDGSGADSVQSSWQMGLDCGYEPPGGSVLVTFPGWPVGCSLGLAGLGDPHDPPVQPARRFFAPPGARHTGPAPRHGGHHDQ